MNYPWAEVDSGQTGYLRELWCWHWRQFVKHFFNTDINYDYNGSKVHWIIHDRELHKTMTTIWSLQDAGYRTSYQKHIKTFFWVDDKYYKQNRREIIQWAKLQGCGVDSYEYGWIKVPNEEIELLFRLAWAEKCFG